jgi:quercetin dioxygenase-like cupin family protein
MANEGQQVTNISNKQTIEFITTANSSKGMLLEMISTWQAGAGKPPVHYHPFQKEYFKVLEGELTVNISGNIQTYKTNESFEIEKGVAHSMWNASGNCTKAVWKVIPALQTEYLLEKGAQLLNTKSFYKNYKNNTAADQIP